MVYILSNIRPLHTAVFLIGFFVVLFFFGWNSKPLFYTFVTYPVVLILGFLLSKHVHPNFEWLPVPHLLVLSGMLFWIAGQFMFSLTPWSEGSKNIAKMKQDRILENKKELGSASRDFVSEDGTFISLIDGSNNSQKIVRFGDASASASASDDQDGLLYIGVITDKGRSQLRIQSKVPTRVVLQKMKKCRNSTGVYFFEAYPEEVEDSFKIELSIHSEIERIFSVNSGGTVTLNSQSVQKQLPSKDLLELKYIIDDLKFPSSAYINNYSYGDKYFTLNFNINGIERVVYCDDKTCPEGLKSLEKSLTQNLGLM